MLVLAAVFEAEPLVVTPDGRVVALRVEPDERAARSSRRRVDPFDDPFAEPPSGERTPDRELVKVDGVGRSLAPEEGVVPQQRERRCRLVVDLDDIQLAPMNPLLQLV